MIKEHDRIVLTEPVPSEGEVGDVGTVVHVYADGKAFKSSSRRSTARPPRWRPWRQPRLGRSAAMRSRILAMTRAS